MKILAIGDFHGEFPIKLQKRIKKIKPDLILSPGDFCGNKELLKLFFKHVFATLNKELWEVIGKNKVKKLTLKSLDRGIKIIKKLTSFGKVVSVTGNYEQDKDRQIGMFGCKSKWKFENKDLFTPKIKNIKDFKLTNYKLTKFNGINILGYPKSSYPGVVPEKKRKKGKGSTYEVRIAVEKRLRDQNRYSVWLDKLFKKAKKEDLPLIFLTHNVPYMTKLDKIKDKKADLRVRGEHYGDYITKQFIKKYQPLLCICGHMHENQGQCKVGKTTIINTGPAFKGKAALIELECKRIKSIKFLR